MIQNRNTSSRTKYYEPQKDTRKVGSHETFSNENKKSVAFSRIARVYSIIHIEEYTEQEIQTSWYSRDEYDEITKQACREIKMLERGLKLRDQKYSSRGLEGLTKTGSFKKFISRQRATGAVLAEQSIQNLYDAWDDDMIAHVYQCFSTKSCVAAHEMGLLDRKAVEMMNTGNCLTRLRNDFANNDNMNV